MTRLFSGFDRESLAGGDLSWVFTTLLNDIDAQVKDGLKLDETIPAAIDGAATPAVDAMARVELQLVNRAASMGAAVAAAFNNNLNFRLPNASGGGGGVNVNVNSPTSATGIYQIRRELNAANSRTLRGYGS
ncbi:MAG: hypothetical protein AB9880_03625 [Christensenellales bacterium]